MNTTYVHIGALFAAKREERGLTSRTVALAADIPPKVWEQFEETGLGTTINRIAKIVGLIGLKKDDLGLLEDPLAALPIVWGPGLGNVLRMARGHRHPNEIAELSGVSATTITRWETSTTRPKRVDALASLLKALALDPVALLSDALWPPADPMIERSKFAKMVYAYCEESKTSQHKVAVALGINQATLNGWLRGRNRPTPVYHKRLAEYFGISEAHLRSLIPPRRVDTYGMSEWQREITTARVKSHLERKDASVMSCATVASYESGKAGRRSLLNLAAHSKKVGVDPKRILELRTGIKQETATFADLLFFSRTLAGLKIYEAASKVGVTRTEWCHWENNQKLPAPSRRKHLVVSVSRVLNVRPALLWSAMNRTVFNVDPFSTWLLAAMETAGVDDHNSLRREMGLPGATETRAWIEGHSRPGPARIPTLAAVLGLPQEVLLEQLRIPRRTARA